MKYIHDGQWIWGHGQMFGIVPWPWPRGVGYGA
jgi:hypothetical protein